MILLFKYDVMDVQMFCLVIISDATNEFFPGDLLN